MNHPRVRPRTAAALSAAVLLALTAAPAATAADHDARTASRGLLLTVSGSQNTWIRGTLLDCPPRFSPHPQARAACDAITWARGDLDALPGDPHPCTDEYDPVTVTAEGTWRSGRVSWSRTFPNACDMDAATGPVFRF
ncbi:SSI family serine proteinase inhibitor [Streptomyces sp. NPDC050504]|uniref:SSI family serine proteinase inhibitor n=1 Tax=Streptomyces sp. NPDC050504 TaxID=3365618 RepID=UPI0037AB4E54